MIRGNTNKVSKAADVGKVFLKYHSENLLTNVISTHKEGEADAAPENAKYREPLAHRYRSLHEKNGSSTITHLARINYIGLIDRIFQIQTERLLFGTLVTAKSSEYLQL